MYVCVYVCMYVTFLACLWAIWYLVINICLCVLPLTWIIQVWMKKSVRTANTYLSVQLTFLTQQTDIKVFAETIKAIIAISQNEYSQAQGYTGKEQSNHLTNRSMKMNL